MWPFTPPVLASCSEQMLVLWKQTFSVNRKCQWEPKSGTVFVGTCNLGPYAWKKREISFVCYPLATRIYWFPVTEGRTRGRVTGRENSGSAFIQSFPKHQLSLYCMPNSVLSTWGELSFRWSHSGLTKSKTARAGK